MAGTTGRTDHGRPRNRPPQPVPVDRSDVLLTGRYSEQIRPDEHGALGGSPAAVSGPSHRGVRRAAARKPENPRQQTQICAAGIDARKASRFGAAAAQGRFRYSGASLAAYRDAALAAGYFE